jgi:hypothetical protein
VALEVVLFWSKPLIATLQYIVLKFALLSYPDIHCKNVVA